MGEVDELEEYQGRILLTRRWVKEGGLKTGRDILDWAGERLEELSACCESQKAALASEVEKRELLEGRLEEEGDRQRVLQEKLAASRRVELESAECVVNNHVVREDSYPKIGVLIVVIRLRPRSFTYLIIGSERQSSIVYQTADAALSAARTQLGEILAKESESLGLAIDKAAVQMDAAIGQHSSMVERNKILMSTVYEIRMRHADENKNKKE